jgi:hypothetical protein
MGTIPDSESSRRSHLLPEEAKSTDIKSDTTIPGHQWTIGMSGMSLYFTRREKLALAIEIGAGVGRFLKISQTVRSKWVSPMDVSNVMPRTVFSVDELGGPRRFELAMSVTVCPGVFARSKLITLLPRFQIVNLLKRDLIVAQDGCLRVETVIPSQAAVPFHWERGMLPSKIRLGAPSADQKDKRKFKKCWSNGCIRLDRIGITSLRLPTESSTLSTPLVVQAEVLVIWTANEKSNPLYLLRNRTSTTILCRQPLQDEAADDSARNKKATISTDACSAVALTNAGIECGTDVGPFFLSFLGLNSIEEFVWVLKPGDVACFGFDDPEKPHILEWTSVREGTTHFTDRCQKAFLEVNAMGSSSYLNVRKSLQIRCQIGAEHSTKVIEFTENESVKNMVHDLNTADSRVLSILKKRCADYQGILDARQFELDKDIVDNSEEDEDVALSLRIDMPGIVFSVIDNADPKQFGREILLAHFDSLMFAFSHTREGHHEYELILKSLQVDNHVHKSIHPVLVSINLPFVYSTKLFSL